MEQYSNLNVRGNITQKAAQGTGNDDIVKYPTLTGRVPAQIPTPNDPGKAIIVNPAGNGFILGEAGSVDDVQINGTSIVSNKEANIPPASPSALGVVTVVRGTNDQTSSVPTDTKMQEYVTAAIEAMPEPMIFKGSVGTGGTISSLPAASASNEGFVYIAITAQTTGTPTYEVGDTLISNGTEWVVIPSGDETGSGTVTNVATGVGLTGGPITTSGTIKANLNSESSIGTIGTGNVYAVGVDSNGKLAVEVPPSVYHAVMNISTSADSTTVSSSFSSLSLPTGIIPRVVQIYNGSGVEVGGDVAINTTQNTLTVSLIGTVASQQWKANITAW